MLLSFALSPIGRGNVDRATAEDYLNRGNDQYELGNIEAAIANYSQAIKMAPSAPGYYRTRGIARHALGDSKGPLTDLETAVIELKKLGRA
jgi:tetratricopeptide (TPR) repeat protein